jgi:hypothetical protein
LIIPPDPFESTDRFALLNLAPNGTITQVVVKAKAPVPAPLGPGELWDFFVSEEYFLKSPFSEILPECNIPKGNQWDELLALVHFSYRNPSEGKHLGKLFAVSRLIQFIATSCVSS